MMSVTDRVSSAVLLSSPNSVRYMPANMPIGVDTKTVSVTIIKLPNIALRKPPPSVPGAGVSWVNNFKSRADKPFENRMYKIQISTAKPTAMADIDKAKPIWLAIRLFI